MLAVVIPATDRPPTLDRCLAALGRSTEPHRVEVVRDPAGCGPAAARNAGVARCADAAIVVFVDADVEVHPDALRRLREALERDPRLDAVFGSYDAAPAARALVSRFRNLLHHHVHTSSPGPAATFWAGLGAVRRDAFEAVGGFDAARYARPSIEDVELGMRLAAAGRRIVLDPAIRGTHLKRWTLRSMLRTDLVARGAPWVALLLERRGAGPAPAVRGKFSGPQPRNLPRTPSSCRPGPSDGPDRGAAAASLRPIAPASALNLGWRHRLAAAAAVASLAAALAGRPRLAALALAAMAAPNARFYALLARRGGARLALAGVPLHLLHHLTAVASVPAGIVLWARTRRS